MGKFVNKVKHPNTPDRLPLIELIEWLCNIIIKFVNNDKVVYLECFLVKMWKLTKPRLKCLQFH